MLLVDAVEDESDEYHEYAFEAVQVIISEQSAARRLDMLKNDPDLLSKVFPDGTSDLAEGEPNAEEVLVWVRQRYVPEM